MRLFRPCFIARWLFPDALFRIKTTEKVLYLTFDDGPDPDSTPQLLEILEKQDIRALFFCNGREAEKYPGLISLISSKGHIIGNHGYRHLNGWLTSGEKYMADVKTAAPFTSVSFFRPPYGRLSFFNYCRLREAYKIVFWDLMPYDFDSSFGSDNSLRILKNKIRPGSIIVLHDTPSSCANTITGEFIAHAGSRGYRFEIPSL
jgi:peptidoglycan/xylan/chitin deacetylase (PgdA/CDA1 family)